MAHARRKSVELHAATKSTIAITAIDFIGQLYGIEREIKELAAEQRRHGGPSVASPVGVSTAACTPSLAGQTVTSGGAVDASFVGNFSHESNVAAAQATPGWSLIKRRS